MLWPNGDGSGGGSGGSLPSKTAAEAKLQRLDRLGRPGDARPHARRRTRRRSSSTPTSTSTRPTCRSCTYDTKNVVAADVQRRPTRRSRAPAPPPAARRARRATCPSYAANGGASGSGNNDYKNKTDDTSPTAIGKTITKTTVAPGAVNKMDVAVMLDKSVRLTPAQLTQLQGVGRSAAGLHITRRGDTLNVTAGPELRARRRRPRRPARSRPPSPASSRARASASAR